MYKTQFKTVYIKKETEDVNAKIQKYIITQQIYFYTDEKEQEMVELHVDDIYIYTTNNSKRVSPVLNTFVGNTRVWLPQGKQPIRAFGQDEAIFRSPQLNKSYWKIDVITTLCTQ